MKLVETEKFILSLLEKYLIGIDVKANALIEKENIEENFSIYSELLNSKFALFLVVFGKKFNASEEARIEIAKVVVLPSMVTRIMTAFFISFLNHRVQLNYLQMKMIRLSGY